MDFEQICRERYSVRAFSDIKVEEEKISAILDLARVAPTAKNNQPYEIYVYEGESLKDLEAASANVYGAPTVFAVCSDEEKAWKNPFSGEPSTLQDIGIIATTLMYASTEYGLGSIYICRFDPDALIKVSGMPANLRPRCLIAIGYPTETCAPSPRHFERRAITEFVHRK